MKKLLDRQRIAFLEFLESFKGYSDLTLESYDASIKEALACIEIVQEEEHLLLNLMPYRIKIAHLNAKTISKKLSAIRSFVEYLNDNGFFVVLKADSSVKIAKTLPKPISHEHIMQALEHTQIEERLVVLMLYTLGLRISELANIKISDISAEWVRVIGKGNKQRDIPLLASTKALIESYLQSSTAKKFLFEKNRGKLSENSLRYIVTKVFERVALKVTPHQLRHSYATALLNSGAPIVDVSELLGHSSMATTQIYTKLGSALKQQNYNKAHPLCGAGE
ncbi:MAG: tyrosine-type recombinase/integrase [Sulfurimonas sp.]|nr:tyrosine-type recombinase/integrase [Sulfurimonas sp.]MDD5202426.1 tyrosine-type recombinase/integrase [Sulfurimonas sp.]